MVLGKADRGTRSSGDRCDGAAGRRRCPIVSSVRTRSQDNRRLVVESVALGLGYAAFLIWVGSAFVGSFGDFNDAYPYWPAIPHLRTDTAGFFGFAVAIVCLVITKRARISPLTTRHNRIITFRYGLGEG